MNVHIIGRIHVAMLLVACGSTQPAPPHASSSPAPARVATVTNELPARCPAPELGDVPSDASLYGALCDSRGDWIAGATITIDSINLPARIFVLTKTDGVWWSPHLPPGATVLGYYWDDTVDEITVTVFDHPSQVIHEMGTARVQTYR